MPKINQEEYEVLKKIRKNGYEEIRRNSIGDIAVRVVGEKVTSHQYQTKHNDKFKFLEATGDYWSIAELIREYENNHVDEMLEKMNIPTSVIENVSESEEKEVKDIEWAKQKIMEQIDIERKDYRELEGNTRERLRGVGTANGLLKAKAILDQLDEPNVDQAYKDGYDKGKEHGYQNGYSVGFSDSTYESEITEEQAWYFIAKKYNQEGSYWFDARNHYLKTIEKPVIPQFVAEWYESEGKRSSWWNWFYKWGRDESRTDLEAKTIRWMQDFNEETFVDMFLHGYEVEEEQKYYVLLGNQPHDDNWTYALTNSGSIDFFEKDVLPEWDRTKLTEQEIKDYDERYLAFKVPVEELEE